MENLILQQTRTTPDVFFYPESNSLKLVGRAIPENPEEFFIKLFTLIDYSNQNHLNLEIDLEHFNSGAGKNLLSLCKRSKSKFEQLNITWYIDQDDLDMIDFVEDLSELLKQKVKIIQK